MIEKNKGLFITFEGPDGAGKSTQAKLAAIALREMGVDVLETREPGGTALGEKLRQLVKHFGEPGQVCSEAELLLFGAARVQHVRELIQPHLERGGVVVCDRFADSTTVYQGFGRGLDADFISRLHEFCLCRWPDLTVVVDLDLETGSSRMAGRNLKDDRFDSESDDFRRKTQEGFRRLAVREPDRVKLVCGDGSIKEVHDRVMQVIKNAIERI